VTFHQRILLKRISASTETFQPAWGSGGTPATGAGASTEEVVQAALSMTDRDIILMHDWPPSTVVAIPRILSGLAQRGLCPQPPVLGRTALV
jgi:hypothetical protein